MRSGALALRGVTFFLAAARRYRSAVGQANNTKNKAKGKKMSEKDGKCMPKVLENIKKGYPIFQGIDRTVFREVLHNTFDIVTENTLMERIFCVWDKQNYGLITVENWFNGLSLYLKGTISKQIDYCFAVYDLNADGYISKEEMFQLLSPPQDEDPDESVKDLVDIVMRKFDKDKDGKVSLADFRETVEEEPLLLEAFGRCLPSEKSKTTFLTTLKS
ncbi:hypothetical protein NQ317_006767 [Molorchus minor]|uniref:EF-hand domain-containing protein n=1 Tax=Molorchus minor TaxID=1323400 RepID=A0ABQ9JN77_9CUCU|nr:hypothetical protein NQ317_006767 [Molorchus minor]